MDYDTVSADAFGKSLRGLGANFLSPDVRRLAGFLESVFGLSVRQLSDDFGIVLHDGAVFQLHSDATYGRHPLSGVLPDNPPRGAGVQCFLFGIDPDAAVAKAEAAGGVVLEAPTDKPHGLREATILSPEGYAFSPAVALGS